jgi:hypothetical protein
MPVVHATIPVCYPAESHLWWLSLLVFMHGIHSRIAFIGIMYGLAKTVRVVLWVAPLAFVLDGLAVALQYLIASPRPYPDCVPFYMYEYGMPAPEVVTVSSVCVGILCTLVYAVRADRRRRRKRRRKRRRRRRTETWLALALRILDWVYWVFSIVVTVAIYVGHPVYIALFSIASTAQVLVSVAFGTVTTIGIYVAVLLIVNGKALVLQPKTGADSLPLPQ